MRLSVVNRDRGWNPGVSTGSERIEVQAADGELKIAKRTRRGRMTTMRHKLPDARPASRLHDARHLGRNTDIRGAAAGYWI